MDIPGIVRLDDDMKSSTLSVSEVAARFGLATHVLRHWESVGLLKPARAGDRRRYDDNDLYRIAIILRSKEAGLSLEGIREMFRVLQERTRATYRGRTVLAHDRRLRARVRARRLDPVRAFPGGGGARRMTSARATVPAQPSRARISVISAC
ncbi:MerR family transcriptional regulator [Amycolatopsis lurida]|uniref:helix-turn-helix domain-containing protein n=1 Tax=Amycolatopsis lurida TaxID=31959 RepID=UPI001F52A4C8|nr:MerR family transcriptional regulator [Amycolatopsis lurida]